MVNFRRWYYEKNDWIVSDEIEDEEQGELNSKQLWKQTQHRKKNKRLVTKGRKKLDNYIMLV